jgi:O-antigen ligase
MGFRAVGVAAILGALAGVAILPLTQAAAKWFMIPIGLVVAMFAVSASREPRRLLLGLFILSLQLDLRIWILHGYAGTDGLYVPVAALSGAALALWELLAQLPIKRLNFKGPGKLAPPISLLFACITLSVILSTEHFAGTVVLTEHFFYFCIYLLVLNVVQTTRDFEYIIHLLLVTVCTQALVAFFQAYLGVTFTPTGEVFEATGVLRPTGTVSSNPAGFTSFLTPALMISLSILLAKDIRPPLLVLCAATLGAAAIGLSFTRAAWIGLALGYCVIGYFLSVQATLNTRRFFIGLAAAGAGAAALAPRLLERLSPDYSGDSGFDERIGLMKIAIRMIQEKPFFGFGAGSYEHVFKPFAYGLDQWIFIVHNEILLRAAETGVVGAFAFVWLLLRSGRQGVRLAHSDNLLLRRVAIGWVGALVALLWQMQWVPWNGFSYNAMLWLSIGLIQAGVALDDRVRT